MRVIKLKGALGEKFGKEFRLDVASIGEGIRALCRQVKGFEAELSKSGQFYRVTRDHKNGGEDYGFGELDRIKMSLGSSFGFTIEPVIGGSGGDTNFGAIGKIVAGILLIGAAFFFAPAAGGLGAAAFSIGGTSISYSSIALFGGLLVLAGVASLLSQVPEEDPDNTEEKNTASFVLETPRNLIEQGHPVPVVYGECFAGSLVISTSLKAEEYAL